MYRITAILVLTLAAVLVSCSTNAPPESGSRAQPIEPAAPARAAASAATGTAPQTWNIPRDARWTILCAEFTSPDHATRAAAAEDTVRRRTALREWYVVTRSDRSALYYGFYAAIDPAEHRTEAARAQRDRAHITGLIDERTRQPLFPLAMAVPLDAGDPTAPAEWDLRNARGDITLQVAIYKDHPERKEAALEAVREARRLGYEAYFYHGQTTSSVCIGAWPRTAIREIAPVAQNPKAVVILAPQGIEPQPILQESLGKPVEVVRPKVEVLDPSLAKILAIPEFQVQAVNGKHERIFLNPVTGKTETRRLPSQLVAIPKSPLGGGVAQVPVAPPPTVTRPAGPSNDGQPAIASPRPPRPVPAPAGSTRPGEGSLRGID